MLRDDLCRFLIYRDENLYTAVFGVPDQEFEVSFRIGLSDRMLREMIFAVF